MRVSAKKKKNIFLTVTIPWNPPVENSSAVLAVEISWSFFACSEGREREGEKGVDGVAPSLS